MAEYIDREALCYQLAKQATIDGQPRAIRRAAKIVADFPAADVWEVVHCADCAHAEESLVNGCVYCNEMERARIKEGFCAWGERKTDDG